ncbi:unnamed protein product [Arctogadus glacialis]
MHIILDKELKKLWRVLLQDAVLSTTSDEHTPYGASSEPLRSLLGPCWIQADWSPGLDCSVEVRPAGAALRRPQFFLFALEEWRLTGVLLVSDWFLTGVGSIHH